MKLLKVFPIAKSIQKDSLTYFTGADVPVGSIIKVPLRKKTVSAIVISTEAVAEAKAEIKEAPFATKKIEKIKATTLFNGDFISTIEKAATYFATSAGSILNATIPKAIIENADKIKVDIKDCQRDRLSEKLVIQSDD